jgi:dihydrodipicolinate synthase/N-acetylneuraminate lyase
MKAGSGFSRRQFMGAASAVAVTLSMPRFIKAAAPARHKLAGLFPIGFTPVNDRGEIDYDGLSGQVAFCRRGGVHGIAWPQIASGWTTLSEAERMKGAEALTSAAKGGSTAVVIGVQSKTADFAESERYAKQAERLGADAIICIAPPGMTPGPDLVAYYEKLGKATALPLFIQTGGDFSVDLVIELFNKVPTFRYVKDEAGEPLERVGELLARSNNQLNVFSGKGVNTMMTEMERGFIGHCPFVSFSDIYASAYDDYHAGRFREAFDQFGRIEAASTMYAQSDVNILVARGVFKPGTTTRVAPPAPGADTRPHRKPSDPEEIKRELDKYLKPYLKA